MTNYTVLATDKQAEHIMFLSRDSKNPMTFDDALKLTRDQAAEKIQQLRIEANEKIIKWYEKRGQKAEGYELYKV